MVDPLTYVSFQTDATIFGNNIFVNLRINKNSYYKIKLT